MTKRNNLPRRLIAIVMLTICLLVPLVIYQLDAHIESNLRAEEIPSYSGLLEAQSALEPLWSFHCFLSPGIIFALMVIMLLTNIASEWSFWSKLRSWTPFRAMFGILLLQVISTYWLLVLVSFTRYKHIDSMTIGNDDYRLGQADYSDGAFDDIVTYWVLYRCEDGGDACILVGKEFGDLNHSAILLLDGVRIVREGNSLGVELRGSSTTSFTELYRLDAVSECEAVALCARES